MFYVLFKKLHNQNFFIDHKEFNFLTFCYENKQSFKINFDPIGFAQCEPRKLDRLWIAQGGEVLELTYSRHHFQRLFSQDPTGTPSLLLVSIINVWVLELKKTKLSFLNRDKIRQLSEKNDQGLTFFFLSIFTFGWMSTTFRVSKSEIIHSSFSSWLLGNSWR